MNKSDTVKLMEKIAVLTKEVRAQRHTIILFLALLQLKRLPNPSPGPLGRKIHALTDHTESPSEDRAAIVAQIHEYFPEWNMSDQALNSDL
jgi:hypothetical protein